MRSCYRLMRSCYCSNPPIIDMRPSLRYDRLKKRPTFSNGRNMWLKPSVSSSVSATMWLIYISIWYFKYYIYIFLGTMGTYQFSNFFLDFNAFPETITIFILKFKYSHRLHCYNLLSF